MIDYLLLCREEQKEKVIVAKMEAGRFFGYLKYTREEAIKILEAARLDYDFEYVSAKGAYGAQLSTLNTLLSACNKSNTITLSQKDMTALS